MTCVMLVFAMCYAILVGVVYAGTWVYSYVRVRMRDDVCMHEYMHVCCVCVCVVFVL